MHITFLTVGTRGDIQPCVLLANKLYQMGMKVNIVGPSNIDFGETNMKVSYHTINVDVKEIMKSKKNNIMIDKMRTNPLSAIITMRKLAKPIVKTIFNNFMQECKSTDLIICLGVLSAFGMILSDKLNKPLMLLTPSPFLPNESYPAPSWPFQIGMGKLYNSITAYIMIYTLWLWYKPYITKIRRKLKLDKMNYKIYLDRLFNCSVINAFDQNILNSKKKLNVEIPLGFIYQDDVIDWSVPDNLTKFLDNGEPPVYIGFGSMILKNPKKKLDIIISALCKTKQRGIILGEWGNLKPDDLPSNIYFIDSIPHRWIFSRVKCIIHHGGSGTTAESILSGKPILIIPFILDQFFWGRRIYEQGLGPKPIPIQKLTVNRLVKALNLILNNENYVNNSKRENLILTLENNVKELVEIIKSKF